MTHFAKLRGRGDLTRSPPAHFHDAVSLPLRCSPAQGGGSRRPLRRAMRGPSPATMTGCLSSMGVPAVQESVAAADTAPSATHPARIVTPMPDRDKSCSGPRPFQVVRESSTEGRQIFDNWLQENGAAPYQAARRGVLVPSAVRVLYQPMILQPVAPPRCRPPRLRSLPSSGSRPPVTPPGTRAVFAWPGSPSRVSPDRARRRRPGGHADE